MGSIKSTSKRVDVEVQPSIALVEVEKGPPKGTVGVWPHRQAAMQLSGNMALLSKGPMVGQAESIYHNKLQLYRIPNITQSQSTLVFLHPKFLYRVHLTRMVPRGTVLPAARFS